MTLLFIGSLCDERGLKHDFTLSVNSDRSAVESISLLDLWHFDEIAHLKIIAYFLGFPCFWPDALHTTSSDPLNKQWNFVLII